MKTFEKGDIVFHRSNPKQNMVMISNIRRTGEISTPPVIKCRWITNTFKCEIGEFLILN
jgi:hypothetical protein